jgi:MFS family permease
MGWSRTALSAVQSIGRVPEALLGVLLGPAVDRYGTRAIVIVGAITMAGSFFLLATITELWQLYLYRGIIMSAGGMGLGGFVSVTVANWFRVRRGRALGITSTGGSFGNATLPLLTTMLILQWGWRASWAIQGGLIFLLALPAAILFRRRPEDVGLLPDGATSGAELALSEREARRERELVAADVIWTRARALRTSAFWFTAVAYGTSAMAQTATNLHLFPYLQDMQFPAMLAAAAVSGRGVIAVLMAPVWGLAAERFPLRTVQVAPFVLQGVSMLVYFVFPSATGAIVGLVLYGLGAGGGGVLREAIWAYYFGRISLGTVRTAAFPVEALMGAIGPLAMAVIYDVLGSYSMGWLGLFIIFAVATALVRFARPPLGS